MLAFFYYCLKVVICSGILYGYYLLALRNNRFHQWNRWYLLAVVVISFSFPLLRIPLPDFFGSQPQLVYGGEGMVLPAFYAVKKDTGFHFSLPLTIACMYAGIALLLLVHLVRNVLTIQKIKRTYREETVNEIHFYNTAEPGTPFSFFKNIFWNSSIPLHTEKGSQMLRHEMAHVTELHSADKVFLQLLTAFAFWNPFLYLIKKELSVIHEFIADRKASAGDDQLQYASLLLMKAMGSRQYALGNPFFHSQLKRRILMLTTSKNPRFSYLRRVMVLPLAALSLILFSFKYKEIKEKKQAAHVASNDERKYFDEQQDSTKKQRITIRVSGEKYKSSLIETIVPTSDMKGVVVNTADGNSYFLNRQQAASEVKVIITDSGFVAPAGAELLIDDRWVPTKNGAFVQTSSQSKFPQYQYTIDTTAYGLSKAANLYNISADSSWIIQDNDIHADLNIPNGESLKIDDDVKIKGFEKALIVVDGVEMNLDKLKKLDVRTFKSLDVLTRKSSVAKYGEAGKNGVILITTKTAGLLPDGPLYVLDGVISTKETVDHILPDNIQSIDVLKDESAMKIYGDKGKSGVVIVTTKLAKNEVTFPEARPANPLVEKVVIGHRLQTDSTSIKNRPPAPAVQYKTVTGYRIVKDSTAKSGFAALVKQPEDLKEVVVVGYQTKKDYDKVFTKVEQPASFPGGADGWRRYLERNLQYPVAAQEKGTQGTVRVQMTVNEDGNITELKALNDPGNGLAAEAERVIGKGPKWVPAKQNGRAVTYRFVQTLTFQLQ